MARLDGQEGGACREHREHRGHHLRRALQTERDDVTATDATTGERRGERDDFGHEHGVGAVSDLAFECDPLGGLRRLGCEETMQAAHRAEIALGVVPSVHQLLALHRAEDRQLPDGSLRPRRGASEQGREAPGEQLRVGSREARDVVAEIEREAGRTLHGAELDQEAVGGDLARDDREHCATGGDARRSRMMRERERQIERDPARQQLLGEHLFEAAPLGERRSGVGDRGGEGALLEQGERHRDARRERPQRPHGLGELAAGEEDGEGHLDSPREAREQSAPGCGEEIGEADAERACERGERRIETRGKLDGAPRKHEPAAGAERTRQREVARGERRDLLTSPIGARRRGIRRLEQLTQPVGEVGVLQRLRCRRLPRSCGTAALLGVGARERTCQEVEADIVGDECRQSEREHRLLRPEAHERRCDERGATEVCGRGEPIEIGERGLHQRRGRGRCDYLQWLRQAGGRAEAGAQDLPVCGEPRERALQRRWGERALDLDAAAGHAGSHPLGGDLPPEARLLRRQPEALDLAHLISPISLLRPRGRSRRSAVAP